MRGDGWGVGVHVHRSERTDHLVDQLAGVLATPPEDPLAVDVVAVPTAGIERFISQRLGQRLGAAAGHRDGVCANVAFPSPASITTLVTARGAGHDPESDPWLPDRAVWPLLAVIDRSAGEAWCAPLARHLGLDSDPDAATECRQDRRFAVASRLTHLFAAYASQRPALLLDWASQRDLDGAGAAIPDDLAWQAELWRSLRVEIGTPSPAERLAASCRAIVEDPGLVDLPNRLSVFGVSRLPADQLRVLAALGAGREVHVWLADASPSAWESGHAAEVQPVRRRDDVSADSIRHPLVRSLGRDSRELRRQLGALGADGAFTTDSSEAVELTTTTLLGRLQSDVRDDHALGPAATAGVSPVVADDDVSIQVHACHGQARQADVVREAVLGLLQGDPTLEPRDIIIMCPDLTTFAPLLSASFGEVSSRADGQGSSAALRMRIADRTPEQSNNVLAAVARVLDLLPGRMGLADVLELAGRPALRARFGFDDDSLRRLADLAERAGIRWGLDDVTRSAYLVPIATGTWSWGLDRLLLGAALSEDVLARVGDVLPLDDIRDGDLPALGQLAELVTRLRGIRDSTSGRPTVAQWAEVLTTMVTDLMAARGEDAWQVPHALGVLGASAVDAGQHADVVRLSLAEVQGLLAGILEGRPTRMNFRSGGLTVSGLAPMRSVPHRVICLVGLDDMKFPRSTSSDGDDVLARDPLVGERDPRSEDRQLLLDAVMAATDHLVITYTGTDDRSNEARPPCTPLAELLDTLDGMATTTRGAPASHHVRITHPLQPFDARNFVPGALTPTGPFSHDRAALAAAVRMTQPRTPRAAFLTGDLPTEPVTEVSLAELSRFLASPPAAFLRTRIGLGLRADEEPPSESLPLDLDGLARWQIGERALGLVLRGLPPGDVAAAERLRGQLPPGALGVPVLQDVGAQVTSLSQRASALRVGPPRPMIARLDLEAGVRLVGTVPTVYGRHIVRVTYSRSKLAQQVRIWPEVLAAAAASGESGWEAHLVARDGGMMLRGPDPETATAILGDLVQLFRAGLGSPLPLMPATAAEYTRRRMRGHSSDAALRAARYAAWEARFGAERDTSAITTLWGEQPNLEVLLAERPGPDEQWFADETTRFGMLARRLCEPLLEAAGPADG